MKGRLEGEYENKNNKFKKNNNYLSINHSFIPTSHSSESQQVGESIHPAGQSDILY